MFVIRVRQNHGIATPKLSTVPDKQVVTHYCLDIVYGHITGGRHPTSNRWTNDGICVWNIYITLRTMT